MISFNLQSATTFLFACAVSVSLAGCALTTTATSGAAATPGTAIAGKVHGGQQPVTGGRIYLLAANPAGYGSLSVSLLTSASTGNAVDSIGAYVSSSALGAFAITGDYSCTTGYAQGASTSSGGVTLPGNEQVYLYAVGGNPGLGTGTNANIGLLAALGPCNALYSQNVQVNEITTVAAAYALAGYATDALHVSSSGSTLALTGLTNAGLNSRNLAAVISGLPPSTTAGSNGLVPTQTIVTIANILSACINGASGNNSCSTLFTYTKSAGASGTAATDTASAAINLAHTPYPTAAGVTALYGLVTAAPAFGGGLASQPNDFTLGITFGNDSCFGYSAYGLAFDASGNAWSLGRNGLCKFSNNGVPATALGYYGYTGGGYTGGQNLAIDNSGNVWVASIGLSKFSNAGVAISPSAGYSGTSGGISSPMDIAIDAAGSVWLANRYGSLSKYSNSGTAISGPTGYTDSSFTANFYGVAIDTSGNAWVANYGGGSFSLFSNSGTVLSPTNGYYGGGLSNPYGVAIDGSGNVWAPDYINQALSKFSASGSAISPTGGYYGGGLNTPQHIAIDSAGKVWVANFNGNTVSVFTNSGTALTNNPAYGIGSGIYGPVNVAVDGSGNVWVTNYNGSLTQLVGAAAPVVTPIADNLVTPYGSGTVNRP
jgi:hypothetical protein